jgi:small-conductance mechanosensitive channel
MINYLKKIKNKNAKINKLQKKVDKLLTKDLSLKNGKVKLENLINQAIIHKIVFNGKIKDYKSFYACFHKLYSTLQDKHKFSLQFYTRYISLIDNLNVMNKTQIREEIEKLFDAITKLVEKYRK